MSCFECSFKSESSVCIIYAQVLSKKTPSDQLFALVCSLTDALSDPHPQSSSGVCVVLNGILKPRGGELASQVTADTKFFLTFICF